MNVQIGQTEKTQGAFIVYENVLFIWGGGGGVKKLTEKRRKKLLVNLHLRSGRADRIILVCANG